MGVTNQIEDVVKAYFQEHGHAWLDLLTGGFYGPDDIPDCAASGPTETTAYGMWDWVGEKDDRTFTELRDQHIMQFVFYSDNRRLLNDIRDFCMESIEASWFDLKTMEFEIRLRRKDGGFKAMKSNKKDRFSKYVAMAQFEFETEKICIELI